MNKWLILKEIDDIKEDQQNLVSKYSCLEFVKPRYRTAAAQILANQKNENSNPKDSVWDKIKMGMVVRLFQQFGDESTYSFTDTTCPENANIIGLRDDHRTIVLEDGQDTVWTVEPIERELKVRWNCLEELKSTFNNDPYAEFAAIMAMEFAIDIVNEIKGDLEKLYCNNNILQYNYCLHSFRLGEVKNGPEEFCPRKPILMKYIKTATFGD